MPRYKDITGQSFNRLTVVMDYDLSKRDGSILWLCKCECGGSILATSTQLKSGDIQSCGCLRRQKSRKYNTYYFEAQFVRVYDSKGNFTTIDLSDFNRVKEFYWFMTSNGYFATVTGTKGKLVYLHNFVFPIDIPFNKEVDHKNRNKSDNRKGNLRLALRSENNINKSPSKNNSTVYTGVSYSKSKNKYRAYITKNGVQKSLGLYTTPEKAYEARLKAEKLLYGDFTTKGSDE